MAWFLSTGGSASAVSRRAGGIGQAVAQLLESRGQVGHLAQVAGGGAGDGLGHGECLRPELAARSGELQQHATLVGGVAQALDQAAGFEPLEQGREGARIELQPVAELRDGDAIPFPQHQHHQVLRVGEPQRVQQRLVGLGHGQRCRIQREAQLVVQGQPGLGARGCGGGRGSA
jgi:hypothetical protein